MKVLFWTEHFWPNIGGIEVISLEMILGLRKRGYEFTVVASQAHPPLPERDEYEGIPIHRFLFSPGLLGDLKAFKRVREQIFRLKQELQPDLVHVNSCGPTIFYELQTRQAHVCPTFLTIHGLMGAPSDRDSLMVKYMKTVDHLSAVSRSTLDLALGYAGETPCPVSVIYNGLRAPTLVPERPSWDPPRVLMLGRLSHEKGFDLGMRAFQVLLEKRPEARLWIAGDGPERRNLEALAGELGIEAQVKFFGWIPPDRVSEILDPCCLTLVTTRTQEPFCLVALQAAQMARPVVATRIGGLQEVIADRDTGILVESGQTQEMAEAMNYLISHPEFSEEMGKRARERALGLFRSETMVEGYEAVYRELLKIGRLGSAAS